MNILRKATLPTLVSVAAIAGVFFVAQPRVLATPDRVIKAIQDIKNYTINSFAIDGKGRHLQARTTVTGKDRKTVYYDKDGNETEGARTGAVMMINDSPMKMGFRISSDGELTDMSKDDIDKMKSSIHVFNGGDGSGGTLTTGGTVKGKTVKVEVTKGPDGKEVKHIFVNGKEVDKLPDGVNVQDGSGHLSGTDGKNEFKVTINKGSDGKEIKHFFVNGKEVDKLPEGMKEQGKISLGEGSAKAGTVMINAESMKNGKGGSFSKSLALVGGKKGEKPMIVQSGQTSADYLVSLLKDTTRWTVEHGVDLNGQKLDKFTLKGPISPIVLYVDPATALPKVLHFGTPMQEGVTIEDVYEYSVQPQH